MILAYAACLALAITSALVWPVSRPISVALAVVAVSSAAYALLAVSYPEAHAAGILEVQRLVSAAAGLVGAAELAVRCHLRSVEFFCGRSWKIHAILCRIYGRPRQVRITTLRETFEMYYGLGRTDALALLCLASMASDGAAWLFFRARWPWVGDVSTLIFCGLAVAVCCPWRRP